MTSHKAFIGAFQLRVTTFYAHLNLLITRHRLFQHYGKFVSGRLKSYAKVRVVSTYITKFSFKKNDLIIFKTIFQLAEHSLKFFFLNTFGLKNNKHKTTKGKRIYKYTEKLM